LKPAGFMLRPATFILKVFKADDLPRILYYEKKNTQQR
jgi:hypothetical protein